MNWLAVSGPHIPFGKPIRYCARPLKYSARVSRSASATDLEEDAVRLAVTAHIRHTETGYDLLLMSGEDRQDARALIRPRVETVLAAWTGS